MAVYKHYPDEPWLSGFECFQYVFEVIKAVQGNFLCSFVLSDHRTRWAIDSRPHASQSSCCVYLFQKRTSSCTFQNFLRSLSVNFQVDFNGRYHQDILNYFSALELKFSRLGLLKFIGQIAKLLVRHVILFLITDFYQFQGDAYLYFDHKYYKINARFPYFGQHWTPFPLLKPNMTRYL